MVKDKNVASFFNLSTNPSHARGLKLSLSIFLPVSEGPIDIEAYILQHYIHSSLTLCHPEFWILVIPRGGRGSQGPQLYLGFWGLFKPPSINVETHIG